MKMKYLLLLPVLFSAPANAQMNLSADSTQSYLKSNPLFQLISEQNECAAKIPVLNPKRFDTKMTILKPDSGLIFKMPIIPPAIEKPKMMLNGFKPD